MNFGAHKLLISTSENQCSSIGANIVACCTFSTVYGRKTYAGVFCFVFPPPTVLAAGAFKDSSHYRLTRLGFSRTLLCRVNAFRPEECVGQPVSSQPRHRKQFGITPTFTSSCWQAQGVTSDAFHTSLIGGPVLPFGKQDLLSGTCWQGRSLSSRVGERGLYCRVLRVSCRVTYSSCHMPFLLFSLLRP